MEGLYHQTNGLLEQTQGYFVRLEQGALGEDSNRLQMEIQVGSHHFSGRNMDIDNIIVVKAGHNVDQH